MSAIQSLNLFFPGSFASASTGFTLFASGAPGLLSGTLPLHLYAKELSSGSVTLYMAAYSRPGVWEDLGSSWNSYNVSCDVTASYFCQDWEYIPYTTSSASGAVGSLAIFMSGKYRGTFNASMPMFISNSGQGVNEAYLNMFMHAEGSDALSSGNITIFSIGHDFISSNITSYISGAMPSVTGNLTIYCSGLGHINNHFTLFTRGRV